MSDFFYAPEQTGPKIEFEAAPIHNIINSICLLNQDHVSGISHWVDQMRESISDNEKQQAKLACSIPPLLSMLDTTSVATLIASLRASSTQQLLLHHMKHLVGKAAIYKFVDVPSAEELASDEQQFIDLMRRFFADEPEEFDEAAEREEFRQMASPDYGTQLADMVEHFWSAYLLDEWPRVESQIRESVAALESVKIPDGSLEKRLQFVTGRDNIPPMWLDSLANARTIIYVPSVHIGPYMILFDFDGTTAYLMGRARVPEGAAVHSDVLDRSELLMRLEALSDSVRLSILEQAGTQAVTTAGIMDTLQLSQSSASRHLTQLAATGLLIVDASERTKKFTINSKRVEELCVSLRELTGSSPR
jgi:DNA-binding transcriptional ArsR family regulator